MPQASSIKIGWKVMLVMGIYLAILGLLLVVTPQISFQEKINNRKS